MLGGVRIEVKGVKNQTWGIKTRHGDQILMMGINRIWGVKFSWWGVKAALT